jgi:low affinity Fe/Cu permease
MLFTRFSKETSRLAGRPAAFTLAVLVIAAWAFTGPMFHYSDTWQLVINTGTTIITFLMVFLIQATQNRDTEALHLKLDEIIRAQKGAHNIFLNLDDLDDEELERLQKEYSRLAERARNAAKHGVEDTGVPKIDVSGKG